MQFGAFTAALNDEIKQTSNIDSFLERNQELMVKQSLRDHLDSPPDAEGAHHSGSRQGLADEPVLCLSDIFR